MKGSCLCGSISFETKEMVEDVTACHCGMCNKWSSSPFIAIQLKEIFHVSGEDNIEHYQSSEWAERAFCKRCGTHLYYKSKKPEFYHFNAALFPEKGLKPISLEIFVDKKPTYYRYLNEFSKKKTEEDVVSFLTNDWQNRT